MRRRGLASPDEGDPLAHTFTSPVAKRDWTEEQKVRGRARETEEVDPVIPPVNGPIPDQASSAADWRAYGLLSAAVKFFRRRASSFSE
jgi:hypothetical protein